MEITLRIYSIVKKTVIVHSKKTSWLWYFALNPWTVSIIIKKRLNSITPKSIKSNNLPALVFVPWIMILVFSLKTSYFDLIFANYKLLKINNFLHPVFSQIYLNVSSGVFIIGDGN